MIKNKNKKYISIFTVMFILTFILIPKPSLASTQVFFEREVKEVKRGDVFSVNLKISSPDKSINVINGFVSYNKDILNIKNVKIDNSFLSMWVEEPTFDNETGILNFTGGVPNGYIGEDGNMVEITFRAEKSGDVMISFKDSFAVYTNDGLGTRINPWFKPMTIVIDKKVNYIEYLLTPLLVLILVFTIIKLFKKFRKNGK